MYRSTALLVLVTGFVVASSSRAAEPTRAQAEFFENKVRPILAENCFRCHSAAQNKTKGNLTLDTLAGALKGGDTGPAIVPGKPGDSLLIKAIRHEEPKMPPKNKLTDAQIAILTEWVKSGAPWPGSKAARTPGKITDADRQWWAFQPVRAGTPPAVENADWSANPIDRFIYHRLQSEGLQPSSQADRATLIRRMSFDLHGLPPSPEEVAAFVADPSPTAYEQLVDRLLASPRYGERWARQWLDLVRYAESDGFRIDDFRPDAWRYRDYVIRALNADKPYDRFVREQLAGDELWPDDPDARTATGYLRHWIYEYNQRDVRTQWDNILNDLTDVTGEAFLGLGFGCARCHDHKFDPILQKDYYRLQAFFAAILPREDVPLATPQEVAANREQLARWEAATAELRQEIERIEAPYRAKAATTAIEKFPPDIQVMIHKPVAEREPLEHQLAELAYRQVMFEFTRLEGKIKDDDKQRLVTLRKQLTEFNKLKPAPLPMGLSVTDAGRAAPLTFIPKKKLPAVEPGYLTLYDEQPAAIPVANAPTTGRRSELARWITRPDNALTTRVIVNRVWQGHFGRGLVATASDFGRLGEKPSHPELLDWLAHRFVEDGWSLRKLHRLILTSATYRQSATAPARAEALKKDPDNRLLWKMATRRLDAEQIRDTLLWTTGELDTSAGGPGVAPTNPRRSIYTTVMRNTRDPLLDVFDAPEGFVSSAERNVTTTATQALLMINSPYMLQRAKALAERLQKDKYVDDRERLDAVCRLTFGRLPTEKERRRMLAFLQKDARDETQASTSAAFRAEKMPYREGRAAVLNPDGPQARLPVPRLAALPDGDFTIEAFVLLRSLYDDASVRTIVSQWNMTKNKPGWSLGVTSRKSAFKPQTLVLQLSGAAEKNGTDYESLFSGLHIALNKPYFVAVSLHLSDPDKQGVTFYAKDLSNDEEPLQSVRCSHKMTSLSHPEALFTIGGRDITKIHHNWDGLIDDVRLSRGVLRPEQLLLTAEGATDQTVGFWQFEEKPGVYKDSTTHGNDIQIKTGPGVGSDARMAAWVDLCHVLLNANEFLYVD
jgi:mono/diheme cytochrome c family protein